MNDCFYQFLDLYQEGQFEAAIQKILPAPDTSYDSLSSKEPAFRYLVNYVDACVFGNFSEAILANRMLCDQLRHHPFLSSKYQRAIALLEFEQRILDLALTSYPKSQQEQPSPQASLGSLLKPDDVQQILSRGPQNYRNCLIRQVALLQGWDDLKKQKKAFSSYCEKNFLFSLPWYPLRYPFQIPSLTTLEKGMTPLIFLEPLNGDFTSFLKPLQNIPALFVFENHATFLQMLQYPEVVQSLCLPQHLIYILDLYPNEQFALQETAPLKQATFQPVFLANRKHIQNVLPILLQALPECLNQPYENFKTDSEPANWLYQVAKRLLYAIKADRLGITRAPALMEYELNQRWHDSHKELPQKDRPLGPQPSDHMAKVLEELSQKQMPRRQSNKKTPLKVAHVVPQVVDFGHAPSKLLDSLITYRDKEQFELSLIITERVQFHPYEYPYNSYTSPPTFERAPNRLKHFHETGISINFIDPRNTYIQSAEIVASILQQGQFDIAVFHGPDIINTLCTRLTDVPLKVLFEHGSQPSYPGFDLVVVSTIEAKDIYKEEHEKMHIKVAALPFAVDVRSDWLPEPIPKAELGFPDDALIMTTISNRLDSRLGKEMCLAIVEILQKVPKAFYAPMGMVSGEERFLKFFSEHGVGDRVKFLGQKIYPSSSQCARSMQLFLNEFPFGSCLGILDAMAAGCPVVTMYDVNGPQQARYGGSFFGVDRAITSGLRQDYVELACKLLTDPMMHQEWSQHAQQQYEKFSRVPDYVKAFEEILVKALN